MKKIILIKSIILFTVLNVNSSFAQGVFFSEWGEGNSNNKYLEITNRSGEDIDLSSYSISQCSNGCSPIDQIEFPNNETFEAGTILAHDSVYVICHSSISEEFLSNCDQFTNYYLSNGDDFLALTEAGASENSYTIIDKIGDIGDDPGSGWDVAGVSAATKDHTLIRKATVLNGNTDWPSSAGTNADDSEWIVKSRPETGYVPPTMGNHYLPVIINYSILDNNPSEITFTVTDSLNIISSLVWDFGDGNSSEILNPVHTYEYGGYYDLALTITTTFSFQSTMYERVLINLPSKNYISVNGSDETGNGSENNPYATIQKGINNSIDYDTVYVTEGVYIENINFSGKNIAIIGANKENTIIDGNQNGSVVTFNSNESNEASLENFTIQNGLSQNIYDQVNMTSGGGVFCKNSNVNLKNLIIKDNLAQVGGGLICINSNPQIDDVQFINNYAETAAGGGIFLHQSNPEISNTIVYSNFSITGGGGLCAMYSSSPTIKNSVFYNNRSDEAAGHALAFDTDANITLINSILFGPLEEEIDLIYGTMNATYSIIQGGYEGDGNLGSDPLFCDPLNGDFTLAANSPAIGAGENGSNIGALGVGCDALNFSLTINEIMNNPSAVSDSDGEWFEIFNNGEVILDLNGWIMKDNGGESHVISSSLIIAPGEYKVLSNNSDYFTNGGLEVDYQYASNWYLSNSSDEIILVDPNGTVFDSVAYDNGATFPDPNGASMALVHPDSNNTLGTNWQASTTTYGNGDLGTPGLPNLLSDIDVELTTIDFDTVLVGESAEQILSVYNTGNTTLLIDSVYTSSDLFTLPFTENSIDDSLELTITFTPSEYGLVEDTLYIVTNDPDEGQLKIPLQGLGYILSPNIELLSNGIEFGGVMSGLSATKKLYVANTGDALLNIASVNIEEAANFTILNYSETVMENDTGFIEIMFSPDDERTFQDTLNLIYDDLGLDTLIVPLSGVGTAQTPIMVLSEQELYFGTVQSGVNVEKELIIYNEGFLELEIEELIITGSDLFTSTFSDGSIDPGDSIIISFSFAPSGQIIEASANALFNSNAGAQVISLKAGYFGPSWHVATAGSNELGDGSEQNPFSTIQKAIDASLNDGDTVLVHPGTYSEDNIYYSGKNIVVSSLFALTQDTSYIGSTIIDGSNNSNNGSDPRNSGPGVVNFRNGEDSTAVLSGFTIRNGNVGVLCGDTSSIATSARIENLIITNNSSLYTRGAGISITGRWQYRNTVAIKNVVVFNNHSEIGGGSVYIEHSDVTFENVLIYDNTSTPNHYAGGSLYFEYDNNVSIRNTTIGNNSSTAYDIYFGSNNHLELFNSIVWSNSHSYESIFVQNNNNNILIDYSNIDGGELGVVVSENSSNNIITWGDNNIDDDPYFCDVQLGDYSLAANSPLVGSGENGTDIGALGVGCEEATGTQSLWHVATTGSDETGDGTEENPFATIQYGINNIPENDSILVHEGIYFENINFNGRKISVIGENKETTIIDGNQNGSVVTFENGEDSTSILSDFKIMNGFSVGGGGIFCEASSPTLNNLLIINNYAESFGGGIHCNNNAGPIFNNVIFENNNSYRGGGINIEGQSNPFFFNSIITNNSGSYAGGAYIWGSNPTFSNVVIAENQSDAGEGAFTIIESNISFTNCTITGNQAQSGGGIFFSESSISVLNSIFWDNVPFNMYENPGDDDGANNISLSYSNFQGGWEGVGINNIDLNPLFCDQSSGDFTLAENSPCIGSGENGTDIGALGVGCENAILSLDKELLPNNFVLHQNYPNPFNPTTKISYDLPEASYVTLSIYDLMGREVRTMINSEQTAGFKNIQWNATDNLGKSIPAGLYIYTIQAGEFRQTRKMVLLK